MAWEFESDRPIYLQLIDQVKLRIVAGEYPVGSKLPAVRDLAAQASVNPNTMQKALGELERIGLVRSQRTSGRYITEDQNMIDNIKRGLAREQISAFLKSMEAIGFTREETIQLMAQADAPELPAVQADPAGAPENKEGEGTNGNDSGV